MSLRPPGETVLARAPSSGLPVVGTPLCFGFALDEGGMFLGPVVFELGLVEEDELAVGALVDVGHDRNCRPISASPGAADRRCRRIAEAGWREDRRMIAAFSITPSCG